MISQVNYKFAYYCISVFVYYSHMQAYKLTALIIILQIKFLENYSNCKCKFIFKFIVGLPQVVLVLYLRNTFNILH